MAGWSAGLKPTLYLAEARATGVNPDDVTKHHGNLIIVLLDGTSHRAFFDVYTAGGTIHQCSFEHFCTRISIYAEMHNVPTGSGAAGGQINNFRRMRRSKN